MRLFVAFLLLSFLAGMTGRPALGAIASDRRAWWFVAALSVVLVVGYYVFHKI
jgi:hypothetical protein